MLNLMDEERIEKQRGTAVKTAIVLGIVALFFYFLLFIMTSLRG